MPVCTHPATAWVPSDCITVGRQTALAMTTVSLPALLPPDEDGPSSCGRPEPEPRHPPPDVGTQIEIGDQGQNVFAVGRRAPRREAGGVGLCRLPPTFCRVHWGVFCRRGLAGGSCPCKGGHMRGQEGSSPWQGPGETSPLSCEPRQRLGKSRQPGPSVQGQEEEEAAAALRLGGGAGPGPARP